MTPMEPTNEEAAIVREMATAGASLFLFDGDLRAHAFVWPLAGWQGRTIMPLQAERLIMMGALVEAPGRGPKARLFHRNHQWVRA